MFTMLTNLFMLLPEGYRMEILHISERHLSLLRVKALPFTLGRTGRLRGKESWQSYEVEEEINRYQNLK